MQGQQIASRMQGRDRKLQRGCNLLMLFLRRFGPQTAMVVCVVWRILTPPPLSTIEFQRNELTTPPAFQQYDNPPPQYQDHDIFPHIHPSDWRSWLAENNQTSVTVLDTKNTSDSTGVGCGFSALLVYESSPIPSHTKVFFKVAHQDSQNPRAESHLREIKAYYLDRILQTNVVPPCVGHRIHRHQIENETEWKEWQEKLECIHTENNDDNTVVEGSMMLWRNGLEQIRPFKVTKHARQSDSLDYDYERESAMNYAISHHLGANMKSPHNHFWYRNEKDNVTFVSIDNDRFMIPNADSSHSNVSDWHYNKGIRIWENIVYERICIVPHRYYPVVQVVLDATSGSGASISSRLVKELQADALASQLLDSQPEAFGELDERVHKLAEYIRQHCPQQEIS